MNQKKAPNLILWMAGAICVALVVFGIYCTTLPHIVWQGNIPCAETLVDQHDVLSNQKWQVSKLIWEKCGVFGDSFGALTALFSALAFCGALIAIIGQYWQLKRDTEVKAKEHFPLLILTPKEGTISFFVDKKGTPSLNLRVKILEKNASNDIAFQVAHRMQMKIERPKIRKWERPVNLMNHVEGAATIERSDSLFVFGKSMEDFLSALVAKDIEDQPALVFSLSYRNFFGTFGKVDSVYRIVLQESAITRVKIFTLLGLLATNKVKDINDIHGVFVSHKALAFKLKEIPLRSFLGEITENEYEEYIR